MTYQALLAQYMKTVPGAEVNTPAGQQAFNDWSYGIAHKYGGENADWSAIPDNAFSTGGGGTDTQGGGNDQSMLGSNLESLITGGLQGGAQRASAGGNTNQIQGTSQQGTLQGTQDVTQQQAQHQEGSQSTQQQQNTYQQGQQTQAGQTAQQQSSVGTTQGTQQQQGTSQQAGATTQETQGQTTQRTGVANDLGLSDLIRNQAQQTAAADTKRTGFLTDVMDTGGSGFQSQLDQGIRESLSGPGMQGVGNGAQGRVAGAAAADIGRNNLNQRLAASGQLAGGSGTGSLAQQAGQLMGQETTGQQTGKSTGTSQITDNTTQQATTSGTNTQDMSSVGSTLSNLVNQQSGSQGTSSTTSSVADALNSLVSSNKNSSQATGSSLGVATGQTPEQKSSSGGGCYVASAMASKGWIGKRSIRHAVAYKLKRDRYMPIGYSIYGPSLAKWVVKSDRVGRLLRPLVRGILYEELRWAGKRRELRLLPWATHFVFHYGSATLGFFASFFGAKFGTKDAGLLELLKNNNLLFT
jgi:hypothetical protein